MPTQREQCAIDALAARHRWYWQQQHQAKSHVQQHAHPQDSEVPALASDWYFWLTTDEHDAPITLGELAQRLHRARFAPRRTR